MPAPPPPGKSAARSAPNRCSRAAPGPRSWPRPGHPQACRAQQTITAGPEIAEKARQKHDYPSAAWRTSRKRRTAAERLNATIKDTAASPIARGWSRLTGITPLMLSLACLTAVRNQRIIASRTARQDDNARRAAAGQPPRTRSRRRRELAGTAPGPP